MLVLISNNILEFWHGESMIDHKIAVVIVGLPCALVIYYPMIYWQNWILITQTFTIFEPYKMRRY